MQLDLAEFASVRRFAAEFLLKYPQLHVLVANAGLNTPLQSTVDGEPDQCLMCTTHLTPTRPHTHTPQWCRSSFSFFPKWKTIETFAVLCVPCLSRQLQTYVLGVQVLTCRWRRHVLPVLPVLTGAMLLLLMMMMTSYCMPARQGLNTVFQVNYLSHFLLLQLLLPTLVATGGGGGELARVVLLSSVTQHIAPGDYASSTLPFSA